MYRRILVSYDATLEGRSALHAGAILAKRCGAEVFLLLVVSDTPSLRAAESVHPGAVDALLERFGPVLKAAVTCLARSDVRPRAKIVLGDDVTEVARAAVGFGADLVVVGHRPSTLFERWAGGAAGERLVRHLGCSLLVARTAMSDEEFEAEMAWSNGRSVAESHRRAGRAPGR